jgi:hypothetical protein
MMHQLMEKGDVSPPNGSCLSRVRPFRPGSATHSVALKRGARAPGHARGRHVGSWRRVYESDCQGRFSSLLIAFSSFPWQSAPSVPMGTIASASGWAEQSFSAGSYQYTPSILIQTIASDSVITTDGVNHGSI